MTFVPDARRLIQDAFEGGYALPAFNFCSLEMARGCVQAAEELGAPIILQTYPSDIAQASPRVLAAMVRALAGEVAVPVALHLDHGNSLELAVQCLRAGYSSVMFDGQGQPFEEVLGATRKIAEIARAAGASLEIGAESFGVPGQGGTLEVTNPEQARQLFEAGADMVACAAGSEHGGESRLDLDLLARIAAEARGPLVLHGGSGIHEGDLRGAITLGVVKVNVGSALYRAALNIWRERAPAEQSHRAVYAAVREAVRVVAQTYIERTSIHRAGAPEVSA